MKRTERKHLFNIITRYFRKGLSAKQIAEALNERNFKTGRGQTWNSHRVSNFMHVYRKAQGKTKTKPNRELKVIIKQYKTDPKLQEITELIQSNLSNNAKLKYIQMAIGGQ